ncbi:MAG: nucleotidyltransferase substrate binding protein [Clostridiales bacterium]|nr:nucleotidyltransferase substrate binding protein [Clostridiales bacterium]
MARENEIYRIGIIAQFNLTFELAWKTLRETLCTHGEENAWTGSPREIFRMSCKYGFTDNLDVWLAMLKKYNEPIHIYGENEADELIHYIRDTAVPAFDKLEKTLPEKTKVN